MQQATRRLSGTL